MVELQSETEISTACDTRDRHAHTGSGMGAKISASVVQWLKSSHTRFQACSLEVMRDWKQKFGHRAKLPRFSDPVTNVKPQTVSVLIGYGWKDGVNVLNQENLRWNGATGW